MTLSDFECLFKVIQGDVCCVYYVCNMTLISFCCNSNLTA